MKRSNIIIIFCVGILVCLNTLSIKPNNLYPIEYIQEGGEVLSNPLSSLDDGILDFVWVSKPLNENLEDDFLYIKNSENGDSSTDSLENRYNITYFHSEGNYSISRAISFTVTISVLGVSITILFIVSCFISLV